MATTQNNTNHHIVRILLVALVGLIGGIVFLFLEVDRLDKANKSLNEKTDSLQTVNSNLKKVLTPVPVYIENTTGSNIQIKGSFVVKDLNGFKLIPATGTLDGTSEGPQELQIGSIDSVLTGGIEYKIEKQSEWYYVKGIRSGDRLMLKTNNERIPINHFTKNIQGKH